MPTELIWEYYQQKRIAQAETAVEGAKSRAESVLNEVTVLTRRLNRLALCNQALWELLRDNSDLTDDDLREKMREIDLRDGVENNQMSASQIPCPSCGRLSNTKRNTCVFCGTTLKKTHIFE